VVSRLSQKLGSAPVIGRAATGMSLVSALLLAGCSAAEMPDASPNEIEAAVRAAELDLARVEEGRRQAALPDKGSRSSFPRPR
jgi:hypothetical protein